MPELPLGGWYNMLTHRISEITIWTIVKRLINPWRVETLGLPPMPWHGPFNTLYQNEMPYLYGFSPSVVPRPRDWPAWHHISGYWFLDRDREWAPPKRLTEFIDSGPQPISIGFGSMTGKPAEELLKLTVESLRLIGQRAILLGGWANTDPLALPETVLQIDAVPHDWLFPRMSAVIHHGGSGTTAAGLRAGVPSILVPFFGDQPYWGRRVQALGVGPRPIQRKSITVKKLTRAIHQAINDQTMRQEAAALGNRIRAEDGVQSAVAFIQTYLER